MNDLFLGFLHTILEFLPISSSFFLSNLSSNQTILAHGLCFFIPFIYYLSSWRSFLNLKFLLNIVIFGISIAIHFFVGSFLFVLHMENIIFACFVILLSNGIFKYNKTPGFFIFLYNLGVFLILSKHISNNISLWIDLFSNVLFAIFLLFSRNKEKQLQEDYFYLGGLVALTKFLPISKLGILITYFKYFNSDNYMRKAFIFGSLVNGICFGYVLLSLTNFNFMANIVTPVEFGNKNLLMGFTVALLPSLWIVHFAHKHPVFFVYYSIIIRVLLLFIALINH